MLKFEFMHTVSESNSIFENQQKAIVLCLVKNVAFLLGHPVHKMELMLLSAYLCKCLNRDT